MIKINKHSLAILLSLVTSIRAWALDADSLGGNPWTSYFRKDVADTAFGMKWFPDSLVLGSVGNGAVKLPFVTNLYGYNNIGDPYWSQVDLYGEGILVTHPEASTGQFGINMQEYNPAHVLMQLDAYVPFNTNAHLLRLTGMGHASRPGHISELMNIAEIGAFSIGLGIYNAADSSLGIYIDQGGSGAAIRIENNDWSTGSGLYIDNNNSGTAIRIDDVKGIGRMIFTCQDSSGHPAFTALYRGSQSGVANDSSMFYWWGVRGHKAEVETVKTALCGLRTFANGVLIDTILVAGVAESTTVVTANYAGGFESTTCTPLRIKVETGAIIVKRGSTTDPNRYYWQATLMLGPGQRNEPKPPGLGNGRLGLKVYPNPSSGLSSIRYNMPRSDYVNVTVYNMLGQKVKTIVDGWHQEGCYSTQWDGRNGQGKKLAAGVYLCKIKAAGCQETQKMVIVK